VPDSCAGLDLEAVGRLLIRLGGNVSGAARALEVPTHDLRMLVYAVPELLDAAIEAEEAAIDQAQGVLIKAMRVGAMPRRIKAASLFLRAAAAGRRRRA
jgi:hypothetical protein